MIGWIEANLEQMALYTSVVIASLGLLTLILVLCFWNLISSRYREFGAKLFVAFFRFIAAASAVASRSAAIPAGTPLAEQPWVVTTLLAGLGYFLWEFAGAIGDHKYKLSKEKTNEEYKEEVEALTQDKEDAEQQYIRLGRVVSHLRALANEKLQRVKRVVQESRNTRGSLPQARTGLAPEMQIGIILETLASFLRIDVVSAGGHLDQNFRIGLYAEENGRLSPIDSFDLNTRKHDPFTSYALQTDRFRLDNPTDPSQAVLCVLEGRMIIISDCSTDPGFQYFNSQQPSYLRSMVAYPLPDFSPDGNVPVRAALLIDTDVAGYFQEEDREIIEIYLREFAVRLVLEYAIRGLVG